MRLNEQEIAKIKDTITEEFGESQIYIFGSRLKDEVRGGDIDIYVISKNKENLLKKVQKQSFF